MVPAGSETLATILAGATWLLLKHPYHLEKVTNEIRSSFSSDADITVSSVRSLTYMLAVMEESMRMFPATPMTGDRRSPKGGAVVRGRFVPENVS